MSKLLNGPNPSACRNDSAGCARQAAPVLPTVSPNPIDVDPLTPHIGVSDGGKGCVQINIGQHGLEQNQRRGHHAGATEGLLAKDVARKQGKSLLRTCGFGRGPIGDPA